MHDVVGPYPQPSVRPGRARFDEVARGRYLGGPRVPVRSFGPSEPRSHAQRDEAKGLA